MKLNPTTPTKSLNHNPPSQVYPCFHRKRGLLTKVMRLNLLGSDKPTWECKVASSSQENLVGNGKLKGLKGQEVLQQLQPRSYDTLTDQLLPLLDWQTHTLVLLIGSLVLLLKQTPVSYKPVKMHSPTLVNILLHNWPLDTPHPTVIKSWLYSEFPSPPIDDTNMVRKSLLAEYQSNIL